LDAGIARTHGGIVTLGVCGAFHEICRYAANAVSDELAYADRRQSAAEHQTVLPWSRIVSVTIQRLHSAARNLPLTPIDAFRTAETFVGSALSLLYIYMPGDPQLNRLKTSLLWQTADRYQVV
jgi:hypothetical protein